ncbi:SH3 domain-binding glutamic acid-rich protein homolog isoform X1 [Macrobrachium rosenbergii]|uniref:SH3 domain-binding glutamic acid-rich protein homolog isoform X1 n=2 Tax=Macrobrachium rosenbergii TaxID=79674 RepID=UPI0034D3C91A
MVIKVYVSTISFSQEVKKNQQRALMILESKNIPFVTIDITDPGQEDSKDYMNENARPKGNNKVPMTPQIFNDADYCGDFDDLDMANECDTLGDFLKLTDEQKKDIKIGITSLVPDDEKAKHQDSQPLTNGVSTSREASQEKRPPSDEPKETEEKTLEEVNEVPPVSVITPAETAIEDEEQTRDLPDQLESKDVDGEVEKEHEEVNEDEVTKEQVEAAAEEEKGVEEEGEVEEEEEGGEEEEDKGVQEPSA